MNPKTSSIQILLKAAVLFCTLGGILAGCATHYVAPDKSDLAAARIRFVVDPDILISGAFRFSEDCLPAKLDSSVSQISMFGPKAFAGLPFSPGARVGVPLDEYPWQLSTEVRAQGGVRQSFGFNGVLDEKVTGTAYNGGAVSVGRQQETCTAMLSFAPAANGDYQMEFSKTPGGCLVVLKEFDRASNRWTVPGAAVAVTKPVSCAKP